MSNTESKAASNPLANRPEPGRVMRPAPLLRWILADNPSAFTGWGTNTWLLGEGRVTLIDPGPAERAHLEAILAALGPGERIERIIITHSHLDHSGLARPLAEATGAPLCAFGDYRAGRDPDLAMIEGLGGGEGVDRDFQPDLRLSDGDEIVGDGWQVRVLHTPGHISNHICLAWGDSLFSADHAMGWATSIVSPPDGDMGAYMAGLRRLVALAPRRLFPGHGAVVEDGPGRLAELLAHRELRERQVLEVLAEGSATPADLARRIYVDLDARLLPAAERNVLAHLLDLATRGLIERMPSSAGSFLFGAK